jgi:hypothetical protein
LHHGDHASLARPVQVIALFAGPSRSSITFTGHTTLGDPASG